MNDRMQILEYSLEIEDISTRILLFAFNIDQENERLVYYFKSTSIHEKVTLLLDMNLISEKQSKKIFTLTKMRNLLVHNREYISFASISNRKFIGEILKHSKTLPANWEKLPEKSLNSILAGCLENIYQEIINDLNALLIRSEKAFHETVFTQQKRDALLTYKALIQAMHKVFRELGQYGLSKKKIDAVKSRHMDLFMDELERIAPEKFGSNTEQAGETR